MRLRGIAAAAVVLLAGCARVPDMPEGPGLTGVLLDQDRRPLPYVSVMACRTDVCFYGSSGADGRFTFLLDRPGDLLIKTAGDLTASPRRASPMVPVRVTGDDFVDVGAVYTPSLPPGAAIEAGASGPLSLDAGDGLTLGFDPSALDLPPGVLLTDLAARRLPESMIPPYPALGSEDVVAVYALHPFAAKSGTPVAVRVDSRLPAGTPVAFRTIDETDGTFSDPVSGTATGESVVTDPGRGITSLTHLVVTR